MKRSSSTASTASVAGERRAVSEQELAKHNSEKDCWICVHDLILALPESFLNEHPGGPDVITVGAGRDSTTDFEDIAHSDNARKWSNSFIIGYREGAPEDARTKLLPTMSELQRSSASGGGSGSSSFFGILGVVDCLPV
eukprot:gnl/TRDRNA2_/TRDRNA2_161856_c0_seq2.p1 gnl/TRDRNA2_/TRDRNA2_161856_c0~~gnl/TRDRNA2_/TRDRNA2_161856_c0_seq2.p1  ORF type:complete len:139 (+),score=24.16 gnl/TRDRNA2_/TRDRNA2_161856_c0_seq2:76-492(+)